MRFKIHIIGVKESEHDLHKEVHGGHLEFIMNLPIEGSYYCSLPYILI